MSAESSVTRSAAEAIRRERDRVASEVTEEFLCRHPDWVDRYGERARIRGIEDARFHVDFLAGAVAAGGPEPFAAYARWAARVAKYKKPALKETWTAGEKAEQDGNWKDALKAIGR